MNGVCGARGAPAGPLGVDVGSVLRRRGCAAAGSFQEGCLSLDLDQDWEGIHGALVGLVEDVGGVAVV
jgi:hypothetical protein